MSEKIEKLGELKNMLDVGLINEHEFNILKRQLLENPPTKLEVDPQTEVKSENIHTEINEDLESSIPEKQIALSKPVEGKYKLLFLILTITGVITAFYSLSYLFNQNKNNADTSSTMQSVADSIAAAQIKNSMPDTLIKTPAITNIDTSRTELGGSDESSLNQLQLNIKSSERLEIADKKLNTIYKQVMAVLTDPEKQKLIQEERKWIKDRDIYCEEQCEANKDGSMYIYSINACTEEITNKRIIELENILSRNKN